MTTIPQEWTQGDITVGDVRLHYTRTGGDKPPFVLAHGFSDDGLCWTPVARALQSQFDVVMVDARGHGLSEAPEEGYNSPQMAQDLAGVITGLGLQSPFIMGHSMGAATALTLAGLHPEIPRAILLEDPPAWWKTTNQPAPDRDEWLHRTRLWINELQTQSRDELIEKQRRATPSWSQEEIELWADAHLRLSPNVVSGRGIRSDWNTQLLQNITCPTLLLTADVERGALVSDTDAQELQKFVPQLKVAHIAGAGHSVHREQFETFMGAVQTFLQEVG